MENVGVLSMCVFTHEKVVFVVAVDITFRLVTFEADTKQITPIKQTDETNSPNVFVSLL